MLSAGLNAEPGQHVRARLYPPATSRLRGYLPILQLRVRAGKLGGFNAIAGPIQVVHGFR